MRGAAFGFIAILIAASAARADDLTRQGLARALSAQPGVVVTQGRENGTDHTQWTKAGVVYRRQRHGQTD